MTALLAEASPVRIFVVDDDELIRQLLSRLLTPAGYVVEEFGTAADALDRIREEAPDLVLLDLQLPDRSGHEVLEAIRADPATRLSAGRHADGYGRRRSRSARRSPKA